MKRITYIILLILAVGTFTSCENEIIMFDQSKYFVAFLGNSSVVENEGMVGIPVMVAAEPGSPAVSVNFSVGDSVTGTVANEGSEYEIVNSTNELSFPDGWGYDTIWVAPVDNDVFTGDKQFSITLESNSLDYEFGAFSTTVVTIVDNEHPLKNWIGTYAVDAKSYGDPGNWDEAWTVTTTPDPDDPTSLYFTGFGGGDLPVLISFDLDAMTLTLTAGSSAGDAYGYGNMLIYKGDESLTLDKTANMIGEISEDGSIHIDYVGMMIESGDYAGYIWDVFDTYWTMSKSAKVDTPRSIQDTKFDRFSK